MRSAGFTMVELIMVVTVIAAFAAISSPLFVRLWRDRRVNRAAMNVAELYRDGRTRALGRGAAVLVRWNAAGGSTSTGIVQVREALVQNAGGPLPSTSCLTTNWASDTSSRELARFDLNAKMYELAQLKFFPSGATQNAQPFSEICYSPRGRTWMRTDAGGAFVQLVDVPRFEVRNTDTTQLRTVFVPPNGVARLAL